jgi:hypothetical protein
MFLFLLCRGMFKISSEEDEHPLFLCLMIGKNQILSWII